MAAEHEQPELQAEEEGDPDLPWWRFKPPENPRHLTALGLHLSGNTKHTGSSARGGTKAPKDNPRKVLCGVSTVRAASRVCCVDD
jgi:hypothetical protein